MENAGKWYKHETFQIKFNKLASSSTSFHSQKSTLAKYMVMVCRYGSQFSKFPFPIHRAQADQLTE